MVDVLSREQRSYCMSRIRGKHTKPERLIRSGLFALGFRFRLHDRKLPGCPDLVLRKYHAAVFVHGCLWHKHNCDLFKWPATNAAFWRSKIMKNHKNDSRNISKLRDSGWRVLTVWECALRGRNGLQSDYVMRDIASWLKGRQERMEICGRN
jgi:DNA mismatch endonuclease (patch repair protein)